MASDRANVKYCDIYVGLKCFNFNINSNNKIQFTGTSQYATGMPFTFAAGPSPDSASSD